MVRLLHLKPDYNWDYLCDPANTQTITDNIASRKGKGDIQAVHRLYSDLQTTDNQEVRSQLLTSASSIPNDTHPDIRKYGDEPHLVKEVGTKPKFKFKPMTLEAFCSNYLNVLRMEHLGNFTGHNSYYFLGPLVELESAVVQYSLDFLKSRGFQLVSVPDLLPSAMIEGCGMDTQEKHTQVYRLDPRFYGDVCLAGTAEHALAGLYAQQTLERGELPVKLTAVSRCYRAEASDTGQDKGLYRVHSFTKVEMFVLTENGVGSENMLNEVISIQEELYTSLGLHYKILDMPPSDLGAPAYRKYDMEAWMPGRQMYGEISSASNCTDYQSRRLNITYKGGESVGGTAYVHTVNGTACASPRILITLMETNQEKYKKSAAVRIPDVLQPYMNNQTHITRQDRIKIKHSKK